MLVSVSLFQLRSATSSAPHADAAPLTDVPAMGHQRMSSPDQLAAEQAYRTVYVPALRRLPGLERYLIGRVFTKDGQPTRYSHLAALFWRDEAAWEGAMTPGISERLGVPAATEWVEHLETATGDLTAMPPVEPGGSAGVLQVVLYDPLPELAAEDVDRYDREVYGPFLRRRPGVRQYLVGRTVSLRSVPSACARMTLMEYENWTALESTGGTNVPPWIRPLDEWCRAVETFYAEFEEVPRE